MSQESRKESCDSADSMMGLSILSMAVLERSAATAERNETVTHPEGPQWRGIKTNDIHQKNGKQAISHRHIEKRRRDRINNTLWMLKDIVPAAKLKYASGSSRLEKADLLEMTVQHLKQVHKSLAQVPEKNDVESKGNNSAALNQVYYNGFTDGIVHILNELKKLNLLTQKQTEQFLMEDKERRKSAMFDFAGQTRKNVTEAVEGETIDAQGVTSVEELTKGAISDFPPQIRGNSTSTETRPKQPIQIKLEEDCLLSEDGISNKHPHRHDIKTETQDSSTRSIFENDIFVRHGSIPATNGQSNCPILLPAYVLHASGTHYVPVLLPPSAVTPSSTKQI